MKKVSFGYFSIDLGEGANKHRYCRAVKVKRPTPEEIQEKLNKCITPPLELTWYDRSVL